MNWRGVAVVAWIPDRGFPPASTVQVSLLQRPGLPLSGWTRQRPPMLHLLLPLPTLLCSSMIHEPRRSYLIVH